MPSCRNSLTVITPFRREEYVDVLTERSNCLLPTASAAGGAGTESKARIRFFPFLTPSLGCHGERRVSVPWSCAPGETFSCISKAGDSLPCPAAHWVHTDLSRGLMGIWKSVQPSHGLRGVESLSQVPAWAWEGGNVPASALG